MRIKKQIEIDKFGMHFGELNRLIIILNHAIAAKQLIDPIEMPRSHAAVQKLLSRLGHEIEKATDSSLS